MRKTKMTYEITKNCLGIVENTVYATSDLTQADAQLTAYLNGSEEGAWTLWEIDNEGNDKLIRSVSVGEPIREDQL